MTRQQAYDRFRTACRNAPFYKTDARGALVCTDLAARAEAWGIFTDQLCKAGEITLQQYETWEYPWTKKD